MDLQLTRETCFEPPVPTTVPVNSTSGSLFGSGTQYSEVELESVTASKGAAADCLMYEEASSAHENSGSADWISPFTAPQEPSVKELKSSLSCSSLQLQLEDEHYMEPISCTDAHTSLRTLAAHYSVEETDPTSSGVVTVATNNHWSTLSLIFRLQLQAVFVNMCQDSSAALCTTAN